jgi:flagellar protein FliS
VATHGTISRGANAYRAAQVETRSPIELVVMLYDGALRFIAEADAAVARGDAPAKRNAISRTLAIVSELQSTLNMEQGGQIAESLDSLYTYVNRRLLDASVNNDAAALQECGKLLSTLRDAWAHIAAPAPHSTGAVVAQSRA